MSALPFPTQTRLFFADEIAAGRIRWYNFVTPEARHTVTGRKHTAELDELVRAGIARVPSCAEGASSIAELTDLAIKWMRSKDGPGSTSPEPGPQYGFVGKYATGVPKIGRIDSGQGAADVD